MPPPDRLSLPFLTRKMLAFEHAVAFDLEFISNSNSTTKVELLGITSEGMFKYPITHAGDGNEESKIFRIPDVPIFVTAHIPSGSVSAGQHYARLYLRANGERIQRLMSGYITSVNSLNWPDNQTGPETSGGGNYKVILGSNPAAGSEASITIPTNELFIVHGFNVTLVTDATAANRRPGIEILGWNGSAGPVGYGTTDVTASLTTKIHAFANALELSAIVNTQLQVRLPSPAIIDGGGVIRTKTLNLQAADDYGIPQVWGEQYLWISG